jgi:peptidoglycan/xylan/chitin deacetylase (PgdA/CDA1 family)
MIAKIGSALDRKIAVAARTKTFPVKSARPIVSFTFDDAPRSASSVGARILEAAGGTGTFYVAGALCDREEEGRPFLTTDDVVMLHERGHELGCHTFSHSRVSTLGPVELSAELARNQKFISSLCGDTRLGSFAYPFGDVSIRSKQQLQRHFSSCRGISAGVNHGSADLGLLKAVSLYSHARDDSKMEKYLDQAESQHGWLIFYTHDVDKEPTSWGASIEQFKHTVDRVVSRGYEILPVKNALGRLSFG